MKQRGNGAKPHYELSTAWFIFITGESYREGGFFWTSSILCHGRILGHGSDNEVLKYLFMIATESVAPGSRAGRLMSVTSERRANVVRLLQQAQQDPVLKYKLKHYHQALEVLLCEPKLFSDYYEEFFGLAYTPEIPLRRFCADLVGRVPPKLVVAAAQGPLGCK